MKTHSLGVWENLVLLKTPDSSLIKCLTQAAYICESVRNLNRCSKQKCCRREGGGADPTLCRAGVSAVVSFHPTSRVGALSARAWPSAPRLSPHPLKLGQGVNMEAPPPPARTGKGRPSPGAVGLHCIHGLGVRRPWSRPPLSAVVALSPPKACRAPLPEALTREPTPPPWSQGPMMPLGPLPPPTRPSGLFRARQWPAAITCLFQLRKHAEAL